MVSSVVAGEGVEPFPHVLVLVASLKILQNLLLLGRFAQNYKKIIKKIIKAAHGFVVEHDSVNFLIQFFYNFERSDH